MFRFSESSLVIPISVECVKSVEWRRAQVVKKRSSSGIPENVPNFLEAHASGSQWGEDAECTITAELEEVPETAETVSTFGIQISLHLTDVAARHL